MFAFVSPKLRVLDLSDTSCTVIVHRTLRWKEGMRETNKERETSKPKEQTNRRDLKQKTVKESKRETHIRAENRERDTFPACLLAAVCALCVPLCL